MPVPDIIVNSSLTGLNKVVLQMLLANECGGASATAFEVSKPVSGRAGGNSGWTIGANQLDFARNPAAATLLASALMASGSFTNSQANAIAQAFVNAGTSSTVDFSNVSGGPVTIDSVNSALSTLAQYKLYKPALTAKF